MKKKDFINEYGMTAGPATPVSAQSSATKNSASTVSKQSASVARSATASPSQLKSVSPNTAPTASPSAQRGAVKPKMLSLKAQDVPVNSVVKNKAGQIVGTVVEPIEKTAGKALPPGVPAGNKADAVVVKDPRGKYKIVKGKDALIIDDPRVQQESVTKSKLTLENIVTVNNRNYGNSMRLAHIEQLPLEEQLSLLDKIDTTALNEAWHKQFVAESFDSPYPVTWQDSDDFSSSPVKVASATLSDGNELNITFEPANNDKNTVTVEFYRDTRQEITGEGDAYRILATVISAIRDYVEHEAPATIVFSAVKKWFTTDENYDDVAKSGASRIKLYNRLVNSFAAKMGYTSNIADKPNKVIYKLDRTRASKADRITEGAVPDNNKVRMINKLLAKPFPANDVKGQMDAFFAIPDPSMILAFRQVRAADGDAASLHPVLRKFVKTLHPAVQKSIKLNESTQLTEAPTTLSNIKTAVIKGVDAIDVKTKDEDIARQNAELLDKMYIMLNRTGIVSKLANTLNKALSKDFSPDVIKNVANIIVELPLSYEDKNRFIDNLSKNKVIKHKLLLSPGMHSITELTNNDPVNAVVFNALKNYSAGMKSIGPGEVALALLSKNITVTSNQGDIIVDGVPLEVKASASDNPSASGGRFGEPDYLPTRENIIGILRKHPKFVAAVGGETGLGPRINVKRFVELINASGMTPQERKKIVSDIFGAIFGKDARRVIAAATPANADPEAVRQAYVKSNFEWYKNSKQGGKWEAVVAINFAGNSIAVVRSADDLDKIVARTANPYVVPGQSKEMLAQFSPGGMQ